MISDTLKSLFHHCLCRPLGGTVGHWVEEDDPEASFEKSNVLIRLKTQNKHNIIDEQHLFQNSQLLGDFK